MVKTTEPNIIITDKHKLHAKYVLIAVCLFCSYNDGWLQAFKMEYVTHQIFYGMIAIYWCLVAILVKIKA